MARTAYADQIEQLPLQKTWTGRTVAQPQYRRRKPLCAGCREREARYGAQDPDAPELERPRTLSFECFDMDIDRRLSAEQQSARRWYAVQAELSLDAKLRA